MDGLGDGGYCVMLNASFNLAKASYGAGWRTIESLVGVMQEMFCFILT